MAVSIVAATVAAGWFAAAQLGLIGNVAVNAPQEGAGVGGAARAGGQEQPEKTVNAANGAVVEAGAYKLSVRKVGSVAGQKMNPEFDISRMAMQSSGQSFGGAGASGFAGGSGGGSGGKFNKPNLGIAIDVQTADKKSTAIVEVSQKVKALDDKGRTIEHDGGPSKLHFVEFEKENADSHAVYLALPDDNAYMLSKLEGELLVTPGKIYFVEFDPKETVTKKSDGVEFTFKAISTAPDGWQVVAVFPSTTAQNKAKSPPERMQAMMQASMGAYSVSIEDSEGEIHYSSGSGSGGGGGGGSTSFSFGGPGGGGSRGGGFAASSPGQTYRFKELPEGRTIKKVRMKMVDRTGETKVTPFTLTDIRLK